ncbi:hypothetical protein ACFOKI_01280 [Sphingomonas qilianensis]|uniref:Uncharacterized protein n=1 Tax=Sphingomonas qilianensis TaxID=1736690 RepID=A0ABU9XU48_9SPHN
MNTMRVDPSTVPGWGIDVDPENDPTYPMRRIEDQTRGDTWKRPARQQADVEILESIEYNHRPAVVGTSAPPSGVSGVIRRFAFARSESDWLHWLMLMGADRINVVEGVIEDFGRGKVPNIPAEMGMRSAWQHNKIGLANKAVVFGLFAATLAVIGSVRKARAEQPVLAPRPDY